MFCSMEVRIYFGTRSLLRRLSIASLTWPLFTLWWKLKRKEYSTSTRVVVKAIIFGCIRKHKIQDHVQLLQNRVYIKDNCFKKMLQRAVVPGKVARTNSIWEWKNICISKSQWWGNGYWQWWENFCHGHWGSPLLGNNGIGRWIRKEGQFPSFCIIWASAKEETKIHWCYIACWPSNSHQHSNQGSNVTH